MTAHALPDNQYGLAPEVHVLEVAEELRSRPHVLRCTPETGLRLRLSVDERHHLGQPILRETDLPRFRDATNQHAMRQEVATVGEHMDAIRREWPLEEVQAFVSNGNLLANPGFVGYSRGALHYLCEEPVFGRRYTCLTMRADGSVKIEPVWFAEENGRATVIAGYQADRLECEMAVSGQPLVADSEPVPLVSIAEEWYDVRHLVRPLCLNVNDTKLYYPCGQLLRGLARVALTKPVQVVLEASVDAGTTLPLSYTRWHSLIKEHPERVSAVDDFLRQKGVLSPTETVLEPGPFVRAVNFTGTLLKEALGREAYREVYECRHEGDYRFVNSHIEIFFKKAVYPHNIAVTWERGSFGFVVFTGKSGRSGTTIPDAQEYLVRELRVRDAILLDNGGDVRLFWRGRHIAESSEGRERVRALLAVTSQRGSRLTPEAITLYG